MKCFIKIWSKIGHTPVTNRQGAFCDLLVDTVVECASPTEAKEIVLELKNKTKGAYSCHYNMPEWSNQNDKSGFCHYG